MAKYQNNIVTFPLTVQMDKINRDAKRLEKQSEKLLKKSRTRKKIRMVNLSKHTKKYGEIDGKTIIRSTTNRVRCTGESNDHPLVYYTIPEGGYVVCGYCDLVFMREENDEEN